MALEKQTANINFAKGLDTKNDPFQIQPGNFLQLTNMIFTTGGLMKKRNGFGALPSLPDATNLNISTLYDDLVAAGNNIQVLNDQNTAWTNHGRYQYMKLSSIPTIRQPRSIINTDAAVASNGNTCVTSQDSNGSYYTIFDQDFTHYLTQTIQLEAGAVVPKVRFSGTNFVIFYINGATYKYVSINTTTLVASAPVTLIGAAISAQNIHDVQQNPFDNSFTWSVYNGTQFQTGILSVNLTNTAGPVNQGTSATAPQLSVAIDPSNGNTWLATYNNVGNFITNVNYAQGTLGPITGSFNVVSGVPATVVQITNIVATPLVNTTFYATNIVYAGAAPGQTTYIINKTQANNLGIVTTPTFIIMRSASILAQAFLLGGFVYLPVQYKFASTSTLNLQSTDFLLDATANVFPAIPVAKWANGIAGIVNDGTFNGAMTVLPNSTVSGTLVKIPYYLNVTPTTNIVLQVNAPFSPTKGASIALLDFTPTQFQTLQVAGSLHLPGGMLWQYDGKNIGEHGIHLAPEIMLNIALSSTGGSIGPGSYTYVTTYQRFDAAGNIQQSAVSVPFNVNVASGTTNSITWTIPTLRITAYNNVQISVYRQSLAQPIFLEVTNPQTPVQNNPAVDSVTFLDTLSDANLLGARALYTNGGVANDNGAPPNQVPTNYRARAFLINTEDGNLLWFSKQNIQGVPVEFSNLFTLFVPETNSNKSATGKITATFTMDDKLIIFKKTAIFYITGIGPDNTGNNSDFTNPIAIQTTLGCINANSLVLTPIGLMFQSDKGIWIITRGLETQYIGAPVEAFNGFTVTSAIVAPGTTQVRFTLAGTNTMLVYDYFFQQWGTFNTTGFDSIVFNGQHTMLGTDRQSVVIETPGVYLDAPSTPVALAFQSGWFSLTGLQGYERSYFFHFLGTFLSAHTLTVTIEINFNSTPAEQPSHTASTVVTPDALNAIEQWRIFFKYQKAQSFRITLQENITTAGAGLTISGLNLVFGARRGAYPRLPSSTYSGAGQNTG